QEFLASVQSLDGSEQRKAVADAGYLVPHWPAPYGRAAGAIEQLVIDEEFARAGVERADLIIGNWALPTILEHGTDEQRKRFVPPTPYGDITWCQMFNEIFLTDVFVPDDCVVGEVGGGWRLARTTLANERVAMSSGSAFPSGIEQLLAAFEAGSPGDDDAALVAVGELICRAQADVMLGVPRG